MCIRSVILKPQFTLGDVHGCRRHSRATQRRRFEAFHRGRRRFLRSGRQSVLHQGHRPAGQIKGSGLVAQFSNLSLLRPVSVDLPHTARYSSTLRAFCLRQ